MPQCTLTCVPAEPVPRPPRLAVVTTHPVQYYAPLFRRLAERGRIEPHVFYGWAGPSGTGAIDQGFGAAVAWDVPLLEGYAHTFAETAAREEGTHRFGGIDAPGLVPAIRAWNPDAVLVVGWGWRAHVRVLRAFAGRVPILFRGDSTLLDETGGARTALRRLVLRWIYRHVDHALYVGQHNRAYFRAHGLAEQQLSWAPHAVDNARFAVPGGDPDGDARCWRKALEIGLADTVALFVGKLEAQKAPDVLLQAFVSLPDDLKMHLVFCGTGPLEADLRDMARGHRRVHFIGFQNQSRMPVAYRLADVVVLPSYSETWGLAVNEAMASGRAVIVSDRVGCAPDLVRPETGRVVPAGDAAALAAALAGMATPGRAEALGAAARTAIAAWSLDETAARIETAALAATGDTRRA